MERSSILIDKRYLDFNLYYTGKTPEYLCENCGTGFRIKTGPKMPHGNQTF